MVINYRDMNDIEKIIIYTAKKKKDQLQNEKVFFIEPEKEIEAFCEDEEDDSVIGMNFDLLSSWYFYQYVDQFLTESRLSGENIKISTMYALESNNVDFFLGKEYVSYDEAIPFHKSIKHMAQALLLGWDDLGINYGNLLLRMLYGKQYQGWHPAYLHPWFMLEIFCKWQKIELDYSQLNYPEEMGIYGSVLKSWDTEDVGLLSQLVDNLCEYHIAESDEDEYEDRTPDFPSSDYFLYAIEILLWLNIRERMGLPGYTPGNELMKLPINNWHTQKTSVPHIALIEKVKEKLLGDYPGIDFEL